MKFAQCIFILISVFQCAWSDTNFGPFYQPLSPEDAEILAAWTPESNQPMWELSGQFEGDMILSLDERNGLPNEAKRCLNKEIPYELSNDFSKAEKDLITKALKKEFGRTCINVRPRKSSDKDYVYITGENKGCISNIGRQGGRQIMNLQKNGCLVDGKIAHEFLHAAGFYHQHSVEDRDQYVTIFNNNIKPGKEGAFETYPSNSFEEKYDYGSVMHYSRYAFSKNGKPTIEPKDPKAEIGQRKAMSTVDIKKLNKMYKCK